MVNTSSFRRFEVATLLIVSIAAGGVIIPAVTTATEGLTDVGDSRSQATEIDAPTTTTDTITPNDVDWYAVELEAGQGITAQVNSDADDAGVLSVTLYGPDGEPVRSPTDGGDAASDRGVDGAVAERSGTYYVKVTATNSSNAGSVLYELSVSTTQLDQHDPNEQPSQAVSITPETPVTGVMTGYDREYFSVEAAAGETLSIETTAGSEAIGSVAVYGPDGEQIHRGSGASVQGIELPKDGRYIVQPIANLEPTESLDYAFQVTMNAGQATDDPSHQITPGDTVRGTTDSTATTYTVDLTEGEGVRVALTHENRTDSGESLSVSISDPRGTEIGAIPADSRGAYRTTPGTTTAVGGAVAEQTGTYTITVTGASDADYSLSIETNQLDAHDPNERPGVATRIESNTTTSGVLTGYDRDVYAIDLQANQTVTVSSSSEGALESALWVAGPNATDQTHRAHEHSFGAATITGTPVGTDLTFTANRTGTYFIKAVPHPDTSNVGAFFESATYEMTAIVSNGVSTLDVSTGESTTITPTTDTETMNETTTPNETLTAPITTAPNQSATSPLQSTSSTAEQPMIDVGTGAFFALGSVFAAFIGVGAIEWWRQSRERR